MKNLTVLESEPPLRLMETMSFKWEMAADLLGMSIGRIEEALKTAVGLS